VIRTDLVRLVPFQVQIAIQDDTSVEDAERVSDILYQGGTLLTDTISDWMVASFETKSTGQAGALLGIGNNTGFDSIALELVEDSTSRGTIDGQQLNLVQVSFEGVSLWERMGTGTAPMEPELVELIQRATFLEDKKLKGDLQTTVSNLLYDLGIDDGDVQEIKSIVIVDVRAYITPPGSIPINNNNNNNNNIGGSNGDNTNSGDQNNGNANNNANANPNSTPNNLEIIIIVAIVVACLAFALLIFAVVWAWRADRNDRGNGSTTNNNNDKRQQSLSSNKHGRLSSSSSNNNSNNHHSSASNTNSRRSITSGMKSNNNNNNNSDIGSNNKDNEAAPTNGYGNKGSRRSILGTQSRRSSGRAPLFAKNKNKAAAPAAGISNTASNGSYPKVIGDTSGNNNDDDDDTAGNATADNISAIHHNDSVVSSDISSSLTAYYKSGMGYGNNMSGNSGGRGARDFNDAASMSSMDSYGYSLDGYAPSLGPAQGGYPVGPMQAAKDAPIPIGDSQDEQNAFENIRQLQDDESVVDYEAEA